MNNTIIEELTPACLTLMNGNIIEANEQFKKLFFEIGRNLPDDIKSVNLFKLIDDNKEFRTFVVCQFQKKNKIHKNSAFYKSGDIELYLEIFFKSVIHNNAPALLFNFFDVTKYMRESIEHIEYIKNLENNIGRQTQTLLKEKETAELSNRKKSEFLASMSHELRTPLNSILGFAELIAAETADNQPELNEKMNFIYNEGKRLSLLINDILDFSKISDNKLKLVKEYFAVKELIEKLYNLFAMRCKDRNLEFIIKIEKDMPEYLSGDIQRILQILINIIGNSLKFTPNGSISIKFVYDFKNVVWEIEVADTGIGIPQEKINSIFVPFEQLSDPSKKIEGTGLGLSITLQLVKLMKGNLFVKSKVNEGTVFNIKLPLPFKRMDGQSPTEDKTMDVFKPKQMFESKPGKIEISDEHNLKKTWFDGQRILAVDDNPQILKLIDVLCGKLGFSVTKAVNGKEALMLLENSPEFFVVFMDLMMPELDGIEAIRLIRNIEKLKNIPVVAVTAKNCVKDELAAFGFDDYIRKPFKLQDIINTINNLAAAGKLKKIFVSPDGNFEKTQKTAEPAKNENALFPKDKLLDEIKDSVWLNDIEIFKIAGEFIETINDRFAKFEKFMNAADFANFRMEAHSIKGVSGFLNLKTLTDITAEFESDAVKGAVENTDYPDKFRKNMRVLYSYAEQLKNIYSERAEKLGVECKTQSENQVSAKLKTLISEDDFITRRLLKLTFEKFNGIECLIFPSGEDLLEHFRKDKDIDIIFTDVHMGGMTGLELAKKLREDEKFEKVIIAMTGTSEYLDFDDSKIKSYFDKWLIKPVSFNLIEMIINEYNKKKNFER